jgi:fluoride exporter
MTWLAIAIGGALGSVARHGVNQAAHAHWLAARFPAGPLIVNVSGCLAIGLLAGLVAAQRIALPFHWREFVFVGLLGGFTTFSTFGLDTFLLLRTHGSALALWNVAGHLGGGMLAVWIGYHLGSAGR